jgi:NIPSNAP
MIVEQRTYTLHPGKGPEWLEIYGREGRDLQVSHLGRMIGYFTTEIGSLNQVIHLWAYEDLEDRRRRRAALVDTPEWHALLRKLLPLCRDMESKILIPASFSPIR